MIRRAYDAEKRLRQQAAMATPVAPDGDAEPAETTTPPLAS
jgi:hypothetical protein